MTQQCTVQQSVFGRLPDGRDAALLTLKNDQGMSVQLTNYGGIVTSLRCPDKTGASDDVVLGYDNLQSYLDSSPFLGALIGRVGNRIAQGRFQLDGQEYQLACNENQRHHLHGGDQGFDKVLWEFETRQTAAGAEVHLRYISADGEEGYPGELTVEVIYRLTADNRLDIEYYAVTTQPTLVNLTHHSYFNLAGKGNVLQHQLEIAASHYTPVDSDLIPTGEVAPVAKTPFDFTEARAVGEGLEKQGEQLRFAGGYDHNFVLDKSAADSFSQAARVYEPGSGRVLTLHTTEPGVQFYSGNFLDGTLTGKGRSFDRHSGFCLEPQHFPDAPNQPGFPAIVLRPGEEYRTRTCFSFSVES